MQYDENAEKYGYEGEMTPAFRIGLAGSNPASAITILWESQKKYIKENWGK